jgi:hypothetical protein
MPRRRLARIVAMKAALAGAFAVMATWPSRDALADPPLVLEATIPLADVGGRIDHMAIDLDRKRLIVAELGNGSVEAIDVAQGKVVHRITGLRSPQGVAYVKTADLIAIASADDGTVRLYHGGDFSPAGVIPLGEDADNLRVDRNGRIVVGYGRGGLAVIDPSSATKLSEIRLTAHPEGFQLHPADSRIFANVPDAHQIAVADAVTGKQVASWTLPEFGGNFPLAIDDGGTTIASVFRHPALLVLFDPGKGVATAKLETCGDADDVFFDNPRGRIYVSCGEGAIDVFQRDASIPRRIARIPTSSGARTSLFVPQLDRLYVAARAKLLGSQAAILVFRPQS